MELAGVLRTRVAPRPWNGPRQPFCRSDATMQPDTVVNAAARDVVLQAAPRIQCRVFPSHKARQDIIEGRCAVRVGCIWLRLHRELWCACTARNDTAQPCLGVASMQNSQTFKRGGCILKCLVGLPPI